MVTYYNDYLRHPAGGLNHSHRPSRLKLTSCSILKNGQDARSTRD
ncbi:MULTISPECIES: hypothetical protein [unclassified Microcoleus]